MRPIFQTQPLRLSLHPFATFPLIDLISYRTQYVSNNSSTQPAVQTPFTTCLVKSTYLLFVCDTPCGLPNDRLTTQRQSSEFNLLTFTTPLHTKYKAYCPPSLYSSPLVPHQTTLQISDSGSAVKGANCDLLRSSPNTELITTVVPSNHGYTCRPRFSHGVRSRWRKREFFHPSRPTHLCVTFYCQAICSC